MRRLIARIWLALIVETTPVVIPVATGMCVECGWWLRCVQLKHGRIVAMSVVEVCPSVLTSISSLTKPLVAGVEAGRTMNILRWCMPLLTLIVILLLSK